MSTASKISIIMPAYNEAGNILKSIETTHLIMDRAKYDYEIIVVDDGSEDNTRKLALMNGHDNVKTVGYDRNLGKGLI